MAMEWKDVDSSQIVRIGYDAETLEAQVQFKDRRSGGVSATYSYSLVPPEVIDSIVNAESVGQAFNQQLKFGFSYKKL